MRCGFKLTAICAADAAIYEPRCPERRLPTKSRARTQASSRAAIRLRRRSPSCALAPNQPVRRSFPTGRPDRTREEAGCWKPLNTPGARMPGIFGARAARPQGGNSAIAVPIGTQYLALLKPFDYPGNSPAAGNTSVLSSRRFPEFPSQPRDHTGPHEPAAALWCSERYDFLPTRRKRSSGYPTHSGHRASPRTSRSPPAKAARTRRRFSRVLHKKQQNNKTR